MRPIAHSVLAIALLTCVPFLVSCVFPLPAPLQVLLDHACAGIVAVLLVLAAVALWNEEA